MFFHFCYRPNTILEVRLMVSSWLFVGLALMVLAQRTKIYRRQEDSAAYACRRIHCIKEGRQKFGRKLRGNYGGKNLGWSSQEKVKTVLSFLSSLYCSWGVLRMFV